MVCYVVKYTRTICQCNRCTQPLDFLTNPCYGVTMMIKQQMTFRFALSVLESEFDSVYRGIKTVAEMCQESFANALSFDGVDGDTIYHQFETVTGPDKIVRDDQVIALAQSYYGQSA